MHGEAVAADAQYCSDKYDATSPKFPDSANCVYEIGSAPTTGTALTRRRVNNTHLAVETTPSYELAGNVFEPVKVALSLMRPEPEVGQTAVQHATLNVKVTYTLPAAGQFHDNTDRG